MYTRIIFPDFMHFEAESGRWIKNSGNNSYNTKFQSHLASLNFENNSVCHPVKSSMAA